MSFAFAWSPELATGSSSIDDQHKKLFATAGALFAACQIGKERQEVEKTMNSLLEYTIKHFADEEEFMEKHAYPGYPAHRKVHEAFKDNVHELARRLHRDGPTEDFISELYITIGKWLINHIRGADCKMAAYILGKAQTE
jgi:hemerythrin